jgi:hypothetical protein
MRQLGYGRQLDETLANLLGLRADGTQLVGWSGGNSGKTHVTTADQDTVKRKRGVFDRSMATILQWLIDMLPGGDITGEDLDIVEQRRRKIANLKQRKIEAIKGGLSAKQGGDAESADAKYTEAASLGAEAAALQNKEDATELHPGVGEYVKQFLDFYDPRLYKYLSDDDLFAEDALADNLPKVPTPPMSDEEEALRGDFDLSNAQDMDDYYYGLPNKHRKPMLSWTEGVKPAEKPPFIPPNLWGDGKGNKKGGDLLAGLLALSPQIQGDTIDWLSEIHGGDDGQWGSQDDIKKTFDRFLSFGGRKADIDRMKAELGDEFPARNKQNKRDTKNIMSILEATPDLMGQRGSGKWTEADQYAAKTLHNPYADMNGTARAAGPTAKESSMQKTIRLTEGLPDNVRTAILANEGIFKNAEGEYEAKASSPHAKRVPLWERYGIAEEDWPSVREELENDVGIVRGQQWTSSQKNKLINARLKFLRDAKKMTPEQRAEHSYLGGSLTPEQKKEYMSKLHEVFSQDPENITMMSPKMQAAYKNYVNSLDVTGDDEVTHEDVNAPGGPAEEVNQNTGGEQVEGEGFTMKNEPDKQSTDTIRETLDSWEKDKQSKNEPIVEEPKKKAKIKVKAKPKEPAKDKDSGEDEFAAINKVIKKRF